MTKSVGLIAPYAVWMILMAVLPATATAYAIRTLVVALLLIIGGLTKVWSEKCRSSCSGFMLSLIIGLFVFVLWILPEQFNLPWYNRFFIIGEGGTQAVAEASGAMIAVRLIGSAFVISVAEELFFRKWLIPFAGFWWMVALFAIEHDRWLVGAIAGIIYGVLYLRKGLFAAIVAHATTNLLLGLWVLKTGQWQFW